MIFSVIKATQVCDSLMSTGCLVTLLILDLSIVNASLRMLPSEYISEQWRKYNTLAEDYPWPGYGAGSVDPAVSCIGQVYLSIHNSNFK